MTKLLHIAFVFLFPNAYGQETINFQDSTGRKQGYWVYCGSDRPDSGIPADGKVEEGYYINDWKEGVWTKYYDDGVTPKLKGPYEHNRPCGQYKKFWSNGVLKERGCFEKNKSMDSLLQYYPNGNLKYAAWFNENGKEDGIVLNYHSNGNILFRFRAKNGVPVDTAYRYYENGDVKEIIVYENDGSIKKSIQLDAVNPIDTDILKSSPEDSPPDLSKIPGGYKGDELPSGYHKILNENGEIWLDGIFKDGILQEGKEYVYDEDGVLLKVRVFKSGAHYSDR